MTAIGKIPLLRHFQPGKFVLLAGPCVVEGKTITFEIADRLIEICENLKVPLIFKASYRKANRSRSDSFTGIGDDAALQILADIRSRFAVPIITDIHSEPEAGIAGSVVDILQIPAFLCRQTSLLEAAAQTEKWVNIKKGQFLSPEAMRFATDKVIMAGNDKVIVTERGTTFGYQDLVIDFRGLPTMRSYAPVVLDCTHSLQRPNQSTGVTGGQPELIRSIARAGVAVGVDGLFIETHPDPHSAMSDGANMLPLNEIESLLRETLAIQESLNALAR